jgi:hypothetical protein
MATATLDLRPGIEFTPGVLPSLDDLRAAVEQVVHY